MSQREEVLQKLATHRAELERYGVRRLALFGSVSRNEARPESDVDLLVDFEAPATFDRYVELGFYLEDLLGRKVDLVTERSVRAEIRRSVMESALTVTEPPADATAANSASRSR